MIKFEKGVTYAAKSICDSNCAFKFKIIKRTAKTVTIYDHINKKNRNCRVNEYDGQETIYPLGKYSMAPMLRATKRV
jgi:hypothetical protein